MIGEYKKMFYLCTSITKSYVFMDTLTIENIYQMLSTFSSSNKKWLADHLYEDIGMYRIWQEDNLQYIHPNPFSILIYALSDGQRTIVFRL